MTIAYHYCSGEAFYGIITSGHIRATNVLYVDDPSDGRWLALRTRELLKPITVISTQNIDPDIKARASSVLHGSIETLESMGLTLPHKHLVCFSEDSRTLSQWRHYARDRKGFVVGFEIEDFGFPQIKGDSPLHQPGWSRVTYDTDAVESVLKEIEALLNDGYRVPLNVRHDWEPDLWWAQERLDYHVLSGIFMFTKHSAFREEREIRLVVSRDTGLETDFGVLRERIVPYLKVPIRGVKGSNPLREVFLGPANSTRVEDIISFLESHGHKHVRVGVADIR